MSLNAAANNQAFHSYDVTDSHKPLASPKLNPPVHIIRWLNRILIEEAKCSLRYKRHYFLTLGQSKETSMVFLNHGNQKVQDVEAIALRIRELGGIPDSFSMTLCWQALKKDSAKGRLIELIHENLIAERHAVNSYRGLLNYLRQRDPLTTRILAGILSADVHRVDKLVDWLLSTQGKIRLVKV